MFIMFMMLMMLMRLNLPGWWSSSRGAWPVWLSRWRPWPAVDAETTQNLTSNAQIQLKTLKLKLWKCFYLLWQVRQHLSTDPVQSLHDFSLKTTKNIEKFRQTEKTRETEEGRETETDVTCLCISMFSPYDIS